MPHVLNCSFDSTPGDELVAACDVEGVCISTGSACSSASAQAGSAVAAMHGAQRARGAVRISLGEDTTDDEVNRAVDVIQRIVGRALHKG